MSLNFTDFSQVGSLTLNGTAQQDGNTLELNSVKGRAQAGSAFYNTYFNLNSATDFSTHFESTLQNSSGLTFILENDSRGTSALGDLGGSYGYGNQTYHENNSITNSLAIELGNSQNSWDTNSNHVALLTNGDVVNAKATATPSFKLGKGQTIDTWVDYNSANQQLNVYISNTSNKPNTALISYKVDLTQLLGSGFYTGFSAGSQRNSSSQPLLAAISNWSLNTKVRDITPPQANLVVNPSTSNIIQSSYNPYTFTVTYQDNVAVQKSTIDSQDIQVTGPNGFSQIAALNSLSSNADNSLVTATYNLNAPQGVWNIVDNGTYNVTLLANQVSDINDNFTPSSTLGTFNVNINQNVLTQGNDSTRSGLDLNETTLNTTNVNNNFGKLFSLQVEGKIYAQPLYVSNVNIPRQGIHNVVYVATMSNNIYAFDGDHLSQTPLWKTSFGNSVQLPDLNIGGPNYGDIKNEVGILSTPVISADTNTMYVVDMQKVNDQYQYQLHALDIRTGQDKVAPVTVNATVRGTGDGSVNGQVSFIANLQLQRTGLLLANGNVYFAFASFGDNGDYHGWVFSYDASTLNQKAVYNNTPDGSKGGIWQAGTGLSTDSSGNIYLVSGNGSNNVTDGSALADSVIKFNSNLKVVDWFTPYNYQTLNQYDLDLGVGNVAFIPGTNLIATIGKNAELYLLDKNNLGHEANNDSQIVQSFQVPIPKSGTNFSEHVFYTPIFWNTPNGDGHLYVSNGYGGLPIQVFNFNKTTNTFDTTPLTLQTPNNTEGTVLTISSNGTQAGTGVVWSLSNNVLEAYDATTLAPLWQSSDQFIGYRFNRPVIAQGKVYVPTFSNELNVYGLLS